MPQNFLRDLFLHQKRGVPEAKLEEYAGAMVSGEPGIPRPLPPPRDRVWPRVPAPAKPVAIGRLLNKFMFMGQDWMWGRSKCIKIHRVLIV